MKERGKLLAQILPLSPPPLAKEGEAKRKKHNEALVKALPAMIDCCSEPHRNIDSR
jgi:hypothetical protein